MNAITMSRRYSYQRLTSQEFSAALEQLGLSMRQFARLSGASERKVEQWLKGQEDIPHHVTVLCSLLTLPGAMEMALTVTNSMVQESKDG